MDPEEKRRRNRIAVAKYRTANREELRRKGREAARRQYAENVEQKRAEARQRYHSNADVWRARSNAYGTAHVEERAERSAKWRAANPERSRELAKTGCEKRKERWAEFLAQERERYRKNPGKQLERQARRRADPEIAAKLAAYAKRYNIENRAKCCAHVSARRAAKMRATPKWADRAGILAIFVQARRITLETGIKHEVDHIIPLRGRNVCGLHIPTNLQILTRSENRRKHTRHDVRATEHRHPIRASRLAEAAD